MPRIEVRRPRLARHILGHVFDDVSGGTGWAQVLHQPSAALKFIPKEEMEKEGYGYLLGLFGKRVGYLRLT